MRHTYELVSLEDVWDHYELTRDSLVRRKESIKRNLLTGRGSTEPRFLGMSLDDIDEFFNNELNEIDHRTCLFLIAAAEAVLVVDFLNRVGGRKKDTISKNFKDIFKKECEKNERKVRLDKHILDIWRDRDGKTKSLIGDFRGALNYRHWLAHGRHWIPKLGQYYDPLGTANIVMQLFKEIGLRIPSIKANPN
jgi:hypothetical protein